MTPAIGGVAGGRTDSGGDGIHLTAAELISLRARCHGLRLPMRQPAASALAGAYRSRFRGRGVDFVESRNYQPGDDIRNMDWRVTARTGKPHTKVFQEERERPVLIVLDASPSLYFGTRQRLKSVAAGHLAAVVAWSAVRRPATPPVAGVMEPEPGPAAGQPVGPR
jgi:uncharacterized protein (DUF58 family)